MDSPSNFSHDGAYAPYPSYLPTEDQIILSQPSLFLLDMTNEMQINNMSFGNTAVVAAQDDKVAGENTKTKKAKVAKKAKIPVLESAKQVRRTNLRAKKVDDVATVKKDNISISEEKKNRCEEG